MNNLTILTLNKNNITDYAEERNNLLKISKTEWNLFLDTDETITEELKKEIETVLPLTKFDGFYIYRKNYFLGKFVGTDKIIRLGKRKSGIWKRAVHETWDIKNVGELREPIIHNTATTLSNYLDKINEYSVLHANENLKEEKKSNIYKIIFFPIGKFILTFLKSKHLVFSIMQSLHSYLSWTNLYFLQR